MNALPPRPILPAAPNRATQAQTALCRAVAGEVPALQANAAALDREGAFPREDVARLGAGGWLLAPFPQAHGGLGMGSQAHGIAPLAELLRLLGRGNLAIGRLFEAHVNAACLLCRYGTPAQIARAAADAAAGHMIALWVTDPGENQLRAGEDGQLHGGKDFCSGAGHATRALVTALTPTGDTRLAYLATDAARVTPRPGRLQGMRAASTGTVSFEACPVGAADWIGAAGDYLREPDFSAGAWRTSAVTCGGLEDLTERTLRQLAARGRAGNPHQQARMGQLWIARETALLWLSRAVQAAEQAFAETDAAEIVATVNFARIAIEAACLQALSLVERSLGLSAFVQADPIERIRRDLATYLRQPAPDEVLTEAAAHIIRTRFHAG